jgi:anti-sigma factor RsiW
MAECRDVEPLFAPYVDGGAQADERATVDAHLRSCPPCRDRVASERAVRDALVSCRETFHPAASPDLRRRCEACYVPSPRTAASRLARRPWVPLSMAATLALAVVGVFLYSLNAGVEALVSQLAVDHVKCFQFADEPQIMPDATTLGREWSTARGWTLKIPASAPVQQLELLGLRRCISTEGLTAHLMYKWRGQPLSVYVLKSANTRLGSGTRFVEKLGQEAIIWSKDGRTYAVVARGRPDDLEQVVQYVRRTAE